MNRVLFWREDISIEEYQKRLNKCRACEQLYKLTGQCKICACFVKEKAKYKNEHCENSSFARLHERR
mgnify:CR=1 FL=1